MAAGRPEDIGRRLEAVLDVLAEAVRACPDALWERGMWEVLGADGKAAADAGAQRLSAPWAVAWHALEVFDYDLNGEFGPWAPPAPFAGHPHWRDLASLPRAWSREEVLGYVEHCRARAREVANAMTVERAVLPMPAAHRYAGRPYGEVVLGLVEHTAEHARQIAEFVEAGE